VILLDSSVLVDAFCGERRSAGSIRGAIDGGDRIVVPSLVFYEWLRGPRLPQELEAVEALLPRESALPFGPEESSLAARLYRSVPRARGREVDLAIAAHALLAGATVWTLNVRDFADIPGLTAVRPPRD
jgi:predicted nucleic acid-binding protein